MMNKNKKGEGLAIIIGIGKASKMKDKMNKKKKMMGGGYSKKAEMAYGGSVKGKKHMYAAGGSVTDNPGLKALKASGPKGMEAYNNIMKNA
jgi:hypothetical protein